MRQRGRTSDSDTCRDDEDPPPAPAVWLLAAKSAPVIATLLVVAILAVGVLRDTRLQASAGAQPRIAGIADPATLPLHRKMVSGTPEEATAAAPSATNASRVLWQGRIEDNTTFTVLEQPLPLDCHTEYNADYQGVAVRWGHHPAVKVASAAGCCQLCKDYKPPAEKPDRRCNVWVFCADTSGKCWSEDIWDHTAGECWLKFQAGWDGVTDLTATNLKVNQRGSFSEEYRKEHKTAPLQSQWTAGLVAPAAESGTVSQS